MPPGFCRPPGAQPANLERSHSLTSTWTCRRGRGGVQSTAGRRQRVGVPSVNDNTSRASALDHVVSGRLTSLSEPRRAYVSPMTTLRRRSARRTVGLPPPVVCGASGCDRPTRRSWFPRHLVARRSSLRAISARIAAHTGYRHALRTREKPYDQPLPLAAGSAFLDVEACSSRLAVGERGWHFTSLFSSRGSDRSAPARRTA